MNVQLEEIIPSCFSKLVAPIFALIGIWIRSTVLQHSELLNFFILAYWMGIKWLSHRDFNFICLTINDADHLFSCLLVSCVCSAMKCVLMCFDRFSVGLLVVFLLVARRFGQMIWLFWDHFSTCENEDGNTMFIELILRVNCLHMIL